MILKKSRIIEYAVILFILLLAFTDLYAFEIANLKFSLYVVFGILFIFLISILKFEIPPLNKSFPILIMLFILVSSLINFGNFKLTSIIYSFLFLIYFVYFYHYAREYLSKEGFIWVLKCILISYLTILILSQLIVLFDLYEIQSYQGYFQTTGSFGIEYNYKNASYRYFSLSSEPSYASIIVMITFATLNELITKQKTLLIYGILTLYMVISFGSSIGFILLAVWILSQINFSKQYFIIFLTIIFIGLILFFFTKIGGKSVDRVRDIFILLFSMEDDFIRKLNLIDSSAYARIGPFIVYLEQISLFDYHFYFGHGAVSSEAYFSRIIYPEAWNAHLVFNPPFFPGFLYDYGVFGVLVVLTFLRKLVAPKSIFYKVVVGVILVNSNFNTQLFWFVIVVLATSYLFVHEHRLKTINLPKFKIGLQNEP